MFRYLSRCPSILASLLLATTFFLSLSGCSDEKPITIGYFGPDCAVEGAQMAAAEVKISGRPIRIVAVSSDRGMSLDEPTLDFLVAQGAVAIIDATENPLPEMPKKFPPLIFRATLTRDTLQAQVRPDRLSAPFETTAPRMADYLWTSGVVSVSIIVGFDDDDVYTKSWLHSFRRRYERHQGVVLKVEKTNSGSQASINEAVKKALTKKAAGLVIVSNTKTALEISRMARSARPDLHIALAETASPQQLIGLGNSGIEGVIAALLLNDAEDENFQSFSKRYQKRYSTEPTFSAAMVYDATKMAILAMRGKKKDKTLAATFAGISSYQGVLGKSERIDGVFRRKTSLIEFTKEGSRPAIKTTRPTKVNHT
jgi:hypothetical protein